MEINGLPLHPLVVHAAVVFGPLAALAALVYVVVPRWRDKLRWPMLAVALIATVAIWVAYLTGEDFRDDSFATATGAFAEKLDKHEDLASMLRIFTSVFFVVVLVSAWLHRRTGAVRVLLGVLLAISAVAVLVWTVMTGDAGAQMVYGS